MVLWFCSNKCLNEFLARNNNANAQAAEAAARAEAARQEAMAEQMRLDAQRRAEEEAIREKSRAEWGKKLGRSLTYDEIAFNERLGSWVPREDLLAEQKAARLNLAAAALAPSFIFSMKEDCAVHLGHNPSYSLSSWSPGAWNFEVLEKYCFCGSGFNTADGRFRRSGGHTVNSPKDLAPWKTLAAALNRDFNGIPWEDYVWYRDGGNEIIFRYDELLDTIPQKNFSGLNGFDSRGKLRLSYSDGEDRSIFPDDLKHWKVDYKAWDKPYRFEWSKNMPLPKICGNCGLPSLPGVKFCGGCGSPLK
jgi:hypothetical protein